MLINNYIYASHPAELNDPFDCFYKLISFENIPLDMCIRFFKLFNVKEEKVIELFSTDKKKLIDNIYGLFYDYTYSTLGILSMTENSLNMQMWSYYGKHQGFQVSFKTESLKEILHGPFPLNYIIKPDSIDFSDNIFISALYQTNIKSDSWKNENEWRYLYESKSPMWIPNRGEPWSTYGDRKVKYHKLDIDEIVLGFSFFDNRLALDYTEYSATFDFTNFNKKDVIKKLLDYLIENNDLKIKLIHLKDDLDFRLAKQPISISKLDDNIYYYERLN